MTVQGVHGCGEDRLLVENVLAAPLLEEPDKLRGREIAFGGTDLNVATLLQGPVIAAAVNSSLVSALIYSNKSVWWNRSECSNAPPRSGDRSRGQLVTRLSSHLLKQVRLAVLRRTAPVVVRIGFGHPGKGIVARRGRVMPAPAPAAVAEVVEESAGVEAVEELAVAVGCQMAAGAEIVHRRPPGGLVQEVPGADFEQDRHVAVLAGQCAGEGIREEAEAVVAVAGGGAVGGVAFDHFGEEPGVVVGAEEVAGVQVAFAPGFLRAPGKLPVVEAGAEATGDGLGVSGALVVAEAVVGEAQGLREHPAFAVVLGEEGFDALPAVAAGGFDLRFEVVEGDEGQDGVAELGVPVPIDTPEALGLFVAGGAARAVAFREDVPQVRHGEPHDDGHDGIDHGDDPKSFVGGGCVEGRAREGAGQG